MSSTDDTITESVTGGGESASRLKQAREARDKYGMSRHAVAALQEAAPGMKTQRQGRAAAATAASQQERARPRIKQTKRATTTTSTAATKQETDTEPTPTPYQLALAQWLNDPSDWSDPAERHRPGSFDAAGNYIPPGPREQVLFPALGGYRHPADPATVRTMHLAGQPGHNRAWKETLLAERGKQSRRIMASPAAGSMLSAPDPALPPAERAAVAADIKQQDGKSLGEWLQAPRPRRSEPIQQRLLSAGLTTTPAPASPSL